jgi:hypothetical protein
MSKENRINIIAYASQSDEQIGMQPELARWELVRSNPNARMALVQVGGDEVLVLYEHRYNPLPARDEALIAALEKELA